MEDLLALRGHRHLQLPSIVSICGDPHYSEDEDLQKALEMSRKDEQSRLDNVKKYNELSMTEGWEADNKYVISFVVPPGCRDEYLTVHKDINHIPHHVLFIGQQTNMSSKITIPTSLLTTLVRRTITTTLTDSA